MADQRSHYWCGLGVPQAALGDAMSWLLSLYIMELCHCGALDWGMPSSIESFVCVVYLLEYFVAVLPEVAKVDIYCRFGWSWLCC